MGTTDSILESVSCSAVGDSEGGNVQEGDVRGRLRYIECGKLWSLKTDVKTSPCGS